MVFKEVSCNGWQESHSESRVLSTLGGVHTGALLWGQIRGTWVEAEAFSLGFWEQFLFQCPSLLQLRHQFLHQSFDNGLLRRYNGRVSSVIWGLWPWSYISFKANNLRVSCLWSCSKVLSTCSTMVMSSVMSSVLPVCFLHPFLGFTRSYHHVQKLIKLFQPRVIKCNNNSSKKLLRILSSLRKFFNCDP